MSARVIGRTGHVRGLDQPVSELLTLGSGRENQLRIDSRPVSRQHAQIVKSGTEYYVEDLGSRNGTFLNGQRVKRFTIRHLDVLSIGPDVDLIFLEGAAATPLVQRTASLRATIVWIDGALAGRVEEITPERGLMLGRRPELEALGAISRRHAVLTIRDDYVTVEDLGSANGTWINGVPIDSVTRLSNGEEISLANLLRVRVSIMMPADRPEREETGEEPETLAVDRPLSPGPSPLERPRPWPPVSPNQSGATVVPSPASVDNPSTAGASASLVDDATRVATREPAIAPLGIEQGRAMSGGTLEPTIEDATRAAPREAVAVPVFRGPTPPLDDEPVTFAQPRESAGGIPQGVVEQARAARDAVGATDALIEERLRAAPSGPRPLPELVAPRSGQISGLRLEGSQDVQLNRGTFLIGRHPECDIVLDARDIGRRHARLHVREETVTIEDLGTANGTFVNDQQATGETEVADGSRLRFATVEFSVAYLRTEEQTS